MLTLKINFNTLKKLLLVCLLLISQNSLTQSDSSVVISRINLEEPQNIAAKSIPSILLNAFQEGKINAYYPKNINIQVPYPQFLRQFYSEGAAYHALKQQVPDWFCAKPDFPNIDPFTSDCFSNQLIVGEESTWNRVLNKQERKHSFVKLIYDASCTAKGLEMEGPVFRMKDLEKLQEKKYHVPNPKNSARTLPIAAYLRLRLYRTHLPSFH